MDGLTLFGFLSVAAMLVFYAFEDRSAYFVLAFAAACWCAAVYAWLAGTLPFALVEAIWGAVALRRFVQRQSA